MGFIYHVAKTADWEQAKRDGEYRISTRGRSLDDEGFIHASTEEQVAPVANVVYGDDDGLVVLVIDTDLVTPQIRYESVPGWNKPFPHIYGPLNADAVTRLLPLGRQADGSFSFTADHA
jgi:glutathione S-transferase